MSVFLGKISTLQDQQWDDIFEKALTFHSTFGKQQAIAGGAETKELIMEDSESDNDELLDPRYDM
jgi:hypothetical protein